MTENNNDQLGQSSTGQTQDQGNQQNQGNQSRDESSSTNCTTGEDKCDTPKQDKTPLPDSESSNKTYSGIANLGEDAQKDTCSHQDKKGNNDHLENQSCQGEQKPTNQGQHQGGQQNSCDQNRDENSSSGDNQGNSGRAKTPYAGNTTYTNQQQNQGDQRSDENHSFQGDRTTGQVKFQTNHQGEQNRFPTSSAQNDVRDVSKQKEISQPERERSTTTPQAGNSSETNTNNPDIQNSDSDHDDSLIDKSNFS